MLYSATGELTFASNVAASVADKSVDCSQYMTKPMIPENAEVTATVRAHADNSMYLHLLILMPRDFANSSSMQIMSKSFAQSKSRITPTVIPGSKSNTSFQHELDKLPIVHKTIWSSFS